MFQCCIDVGHMLDTRHAFNIKYRWDFKWFINNVIKFKHGVLNDMHRKIKGVSMLSMMDFSRKSCGRADMTTHCRVAPKSRAACHTNVPRGFLFVISSNLHRKMTSEIKTMRILNYKT